MEIDWSSKKTSKKKYKKFDSESKPGNEATLMGCVNAILAEIERSLQQESVSLEKLIKGFSYEGHGKKFKAFKECIYSLDLFKVGKAKEFVLAVKDYFAKQMNLHLKKVETINSIIIDSMRNDERNLLIDVNERLNQLRKSCFQELAKPIRMLNDAKSSIGKVEAAAHDYSAFVDQKLLDNEDKFENISEKIKEIHRSALNAYNDLSEQMMLIESRFEQEKVNIEKQIVEAKRKAEQKTVSKLKEKHDVLYAKIRQHNLDVKEFDKETGIKLLLKKLATVEAEFKALAQAEKHYEDQCTKYDKIKEIIESDKIRIEELTLAELDYKGCLIKVRQNKITAEPVDAVVNSTTEDLSNNVGNAKKIEESAGPEYRKECDLYLQKHGKLPTGEVMVATGGNLPCDYVINVVGPRCEKNQEDITLESKQLKRLFKNILKAAVENDFKSVSIVAVSTGMLNFPLKE